MSLNPLKNETVPWQRSEINKLIFIPAALFFLIQVIAGTNYPVFRDEFYYLDCASRLAFGYVDQPPFSILVLAVWKFFFSDSLLSLRILPALFGSLFIISSGFLARELGGNKFSQFLASVVIFCAPVYWALCSFYSMNSIDILIWVVLFIILARIINNGTDKLWVILGIAAGIGLMNKLSVGYFGVALAAAILCTPSRKWYANKYFWLFGAIAFLIFSPYIIWNFQNDFASLEFIRNASQFKNVKLTPFQFLKDLILQVNPLNIFVWLTGLYALLFSSKLKQYRLFGFTFLFILLIVFLNNGKPYYMAVAFPILLTAGSVRISEFFESRKLKILKYAVPVILLASIVFLLPLVIPVLQPEQAADYFRKLGIKTASGEKKKTGTLPQTFADRFGWEELAGIVLNIYNALPEEEKKHTAVYTNNYGEAGAINYYSKGKEKPEVLSGHNNHFLWPPENDDITTLIIVGGSIENHLKTFEEVTEAGRTRNEYSMPYENDMPVFIARKPKVKLKDIWKKTKHYD